MRRCYCRHVVGKCNICHWDQNDFVAIKDVGAYGSVLSSNYNSKPLIAEILVNRRKFKIIRKKQDLNKLIKY